MTGLAREFLSHAERWGVEPHVVRSIMRGTDDIEVLIDGIDRLALAREPLELIGERLEAADRVDAVRAEVEWFVQHAAERVTAASAHLMWGPVLRARLSADLTFVTTNYDRAIELAANVEETALNDGFAPFGTGETAPLARVQRGRHPAPLLVKLHGSTDWYSADGRPTKLRHPMPLFGRATLQLAGGQRLGSALILPLERRS
ncbi:MAG: hypothetical protein R3E98_19290 [Gemmatimonadota bacterium]